MFVLRRKGGKGAEADGEGAGLTEGRLFSIVAGKRRAFFAFRGSTMNLISSPDKAPVFLARSFFERPFLTVARDLAGCTLVWDGCAGRIVELEAYGVEGDAACHTASRPSTRRFVEENPAGTAYVYLNYGMYWLLNVLVKGGGKDGILLLRALEPVAGLERMRERRGREEAADLCSGPGKLGRALGLGAADHGCELASAVTLGRGRGFLPRSEGGKISLITDGRIGISQAAELPWRFSVRGHPHVSVKPRELALTETGRKGRPQLKNKRHKDKMMP